MSKEPLPTDDALGLDKSVVRLSPHNPHWPALGEAECAVVATLLGDLAVAVVHVGSTAVPGLEAKPILDIVAAVDDRMPIDDVVAHLCGEGPYTEGACRTVHVHVVGKSSRAWMSYLRFHALLLDDAEVRERYQSSKRELAQAFAQDRQGYTTAKSAIVEEMLASESESPPHVP
jgi:GrpB-like predicted nucleotidyltransferase (UPF0157 family)